MTAALPGASTCTIHHAATVVMVTQPNPLLTTAYSCPAIGDRPAVVAISPFINPLLWFSR